MLKFEKKIRRQKVNKGKAMPLIKHYTINTKERVISMKLRPHSFDKRLRKFQCRPGRDAPASQKYPCTIRTPIVLYITKSPLWLGHDRYVHRMNSGDSVVYRTKMSVTSNTYHFGVEWMIHWKGFERMLGRGPIDVKYWPEYSPISSLTLCTAAIRTA